MYPNLRAEMARNRITQKIIAEQTGKTIAFISGKLNGKSDISLPLAFQIKHIVGTDMALEDLFARE